jgi:hypothetical protein
MLKENISPTPSDQFLQNNQLDLGSDIYATPANGDGAALPDLRITSLSDLVVTTEFATDSPEMAGGGPTVIGNPDCSVKDGQCA